VNALPLYDEQQLLIRLADSDETAFTIIYNHYWDRLFAVAAIKLDSLPEAEEIVQDIFADIWNRRSSLAITSGLNAYLAVAVKYKVINVLAKRNRQHSYNEYSSQAIGNMNFSTEQWLEFEELKGRLKKLVISLPEKCRLVFEMSREQGLSHREIASTLGIAEKTVESHLSKALHTLRTNLDSFLFFLI
jgi:RNA polymerase sigma-70 factor (ECF subfamily)